MVRRPVLFLLVIAAAMILVWSLWDQENAPDVGTHETAGQDPAALWAIAGANFRELDAALRDPTSSDALLLRCLDAVESDLDTLLLVSQVEPTGLRAETGDSPKEFVRAEGGRILLRAFALPSRAGGGDPREEVNRRAVEGIGLMATVLNAEGRERLSKRVRKRVERLQTGRDYEPSLSLLRAAFNALARLGSLDSFRWMVKEFTNGVPRRKYFLMAAHGAMTRFEHVPAADRYTATRRMLMTYAAVEGMAARPDKWGMSKRALWRALKGSALACMRYLTGDPRDSYGQPFRTMADFLEWFRHHNDPASEPWVSGI